MVSLWFSVTTRPRSRLNLRIASCSPSTSRFFVSASETSEHALIGAWGCGSFPDQEINLFHVHQTVYSVTPSSEVEEYRILQQFSAVTRETMGNRQKQAVIHSMLQSVVRWLGSVSWGNRKFYVLNVTNTLHNDMVTLQNV